jgi:two-component system chemotaxis response regulator CheY
MSAIAIVCIEDEAEVRDALLRDLAPFRESFRIEGADNAEDARALLRDLAAQGAAVGLILCDHLLPGLRGVDFLIELRKQDPAMKTRLVLITGQAGLEDTVRAINEAGLHHYIAKPWKPDALHAVVRNQLTEYVLASDVDLLPYVAVLDGPRLLAAISQRKMDT